MKFQNHWLLYAYTFLLFGQILDGLTTKIGLDIGLAEVGRYAMPVLQDYGFWGLMAWKFGFIAAVGVLMLVLFKVVEKYKPQDLRRVAKILTIGCIIAAAGTAQIVVSNYQQIQMGLQHLVEGSVVR